MAVVVRVVLAGQGEGSGCSGGGDGGGDSGGDGGGAGRLFPGRSDAGSGEAHTRGLAGIFVMRRIFPAGLLWTPLYARPHLPHPRGRH